MKNLLCVFFILVFLLSCQKNQQQHNSTSTLTSQKEISINWIFETTPSEIDPAMPITTIFLDLNKEKVLLVTDLQGDYKVMDKNQRTNWDIPKSALSACIGGYGGLISTVYVEQTTDSLLITQAWSDAEADRDGWIDAKIIKTIPLSN